MGVGVPLISRASTFYSLRQSWLPLFGCQYKSRGSGAIENSRERTELIGCTEQSEGSEAIALLPRRWLTVSRGSFTGKGQPQNATVPMKTLFLIVLTEVEHCCLADSQHYVFVCHKTMVQL